MTTGTTTEYETYGQPPITTSSDLTLVPTETVVEPLSSIVSVPSLPVSTQASAGSSIPIISSIPGPFPRNITSTVVVTPIPSSILNNTLTPSVTSKTPSQVPLPHIGPCPEIDNTYLTVPNGDRYSIQCYVDYPGPVTEALEVSNLRSCLIACSDFNRGVFGIDSCHGISYFPNKIGRNCYFRTVTDAPIVNFSFQEVSAVLVLIDSLPESSKNTSTASSAGVLPPTGILSSFNISTRFPGSVTSATSSLIPSYLTNLTMTAGPTAGTPIPPLSSLTLNATVPR